MKSRKSRAQLGTYSVLSYDGSNQTVTPIFCSERRCRFFYLTFELRTTVPVKSVFWLLFELFFCGKLVPITVKIESRIAQ